MEGKTALVAALFLDVKWIGIDDLKLTQIYLSRKKIENILRWFDESLANFEPVSVRDFLNNGNLHLTDGHSRAYVAWTKGLKQIPCVYDESPIVSNRIGQIQYENDIEWCERFQLRHISHLSERILSEEEYETLWRGRCGYMYDLEVALLDRTINRRAFMRRKAELEGLGVFVVGISEDFQTIHCENAAGELFGFPFLA